MSTSDPNRFERIEILLESIATDLASAKDIAISNAKAIEASRDEFSSFRQEWQLDRSRLYQAMSELATAQANFYSQQATFYQRQEELDQRQNELSRRQGEIVEILKLLSQRVNQSSP